MAELNFDATNAPRQESFEPIPAGWYTAMMTKSEMMPSKTGGSFLDVVFTIIEGPYKDRKVFEKLNLVNANAITQEIAYKQLAEIAHSTGVLQIKDSQMLHGKPLRIRVKIREAANGFDASNSISGYKKVDAAAQTSGNYIQAVGYADTVTALGNTGTAINLDVTSGNVFTATLTGNATITLRYPVATGSSSFTLILTNGSGGPYTVAWAGGTFKFPGGAASLSRTTTAGAIDVWFFFTPDGGTTWYGSIPMANLTT
jgi:hypothetical protein